LAKGEVQKKNKSPYGYGDQRLTAFNWKIVSGRCFTECISVHVSCGRSEVATGSKIPEGPKTQIDVVGIEDELALAVECKSQGEFAKRSQFQEELAKLVQIREKFIRSSNEQFKGPHKRQSALLFFVSNVDLSSNEQERAKEANVKCV